MEEVTLPDLGKIPEIDEIAVPRWTLPLKFPLKCRMLNKETSMET